MVVKSGCAECDYLRMREFSTILGSCVVPWIAQSFFDSEGFGVEVDSGVGVVEAARAFTAAEVLFGQSLAICPDTPLETALPFLRGKLAVFPEFGR